MAPVVSPSKAPAKSRPCVLVVDDEPGLVELVVDVAEPLACRILTAANVSQAKHLLSTHDVQVMVTDLHLPDGDGVSLLSLLQRQHPAARAVVITGQASVESAVDALRLGAVDFIPKPFSNEMLLTRLRKAIEGQARSAKDGRKIERLRVAVRRLNEARRTISKKVDLLCNDLVGAYGELSRQLEDVRTQEGFRKYVGGAKDLEQLLCHAMDWLLRQVGYSNVAVWLSGEDGDYQLGAYMKYTVPGEPILTDALRRVVLPLAPTDGVVRLQGAELSDRLSPQELKYLRGHEVLALNCTYLGESLAGLVFFRSAQNPFGEEDESLLKSIGPIFAVALASVVRDVDAPDEPGSSDLDSGPEPTGTTDTQDPRDGDGNGDGKDNRRPGGPGTGGKSRRPPRDAADWWKRGEPPPF